MSGLQGSYRLGKSEGYTNKDYALHTGGSYDILDEGFDWDDDDYDPMAWYRENERKEAKKREYHEWKLVAIFIVTVAVVLLSGGLS